MSSSKHLDSQSIYSVCSDGELRIFIDRFLSEIDDYSWSESKEVKALVVVARRLHLASDTLVTSLEDREPEYIYEQDDAEIERLEGELREAKQKLAKTDRSYVDQLIDKIADLRRELGRSGDLVQKLGQDIDRAEDSMVGYRNDVRRLTAANEQLQARLKALSSKPRARRFRRRRKKSKFREIFE